MAETLTIGIAFIGGIVSFFSPCILPLIPGFLSYLSGTRPDEIKAKRLQFRVFLNTVLFVLGFSVIFILLGSLAGLAGEALPAFRIWLARLGGVVIIIFGLWTLGLLRLGFFSRERGIKITRFKRFGPAGPFFVGGSFGAGWSPCVGPVLSVILGLTLSTASVGEGAFLLSIYSLGLAIPFLITGAFTAQVSSFITRYTQTSGNVKHIFMILKILAGLLLIILGIFVFTNNIERFLSLFTLG